MFYYFFTQYKKEVLKPPRFKLSKKDCAISLLLIALAILNIILAILQKIALFALISIVMFIVMFIVQKKTTKKEYEQLDENLANFKSERLDKLVSLLKDENYNLYTIEGINLLITYCDEKISQFTVKLPFQGVVTSVFLLAYGTVIANSTPVEIIANAIFFIICFIILALSLRGYQSIIDEIAYPDKSKYMALKNQLEYIKTQII